MKILAISDRIVQELHSPVIKEQFGDVDLVLACGDLPPHYLEFVVNQLKVPLLYVFGNHDQGVYTRSGGFKKGPTGGLNVDGRVAEVKGLLVAGLEGSMRYSGRGEHQYTEWDMRLKALRLAPILLGNRLRHGRFLDILITHAPPLGIHDGTDVCHTGFRAFCWMMDLFRPRYLIHGHQHVYHPSTTVRTTYHRTRVVNAYGYQVIDWEEADPDNAPSPDPRESAEGSPSLGAVRRRRP
jgi:Icc-related predicted phosphoesterase